MAILTTARVGRDFRITVPKEVRELLALSEGDELVFYRLGRTKGRVCFRKSSH
jgi:AbrB family looped-hinge helix DNA binding protein